MVDFTLTDEQKALREMAHDFAEKEIRPVAWQYDRDGTWPAGDHREGVGAGAHEHPRPRGVRRPRGVLPRRLHHRGGALLGVLGHPDLARRQRPRERAGRPRRLGRDEAQVPRDAHRGAEARVVLPDRAGRRLRRVGHAHARGPQGRHVRPQRPEVLHHQRRPRRLVHGLREDRPRGRPPGHLRVRRRQGRHGDRRQEGGQDGPAGVQHRDHHLQRHRGPRREPPRPGEQGLQDRDGDPRPHAPRRRRDGRRHRPRRVRVRRRLLEGARPVRRADRDAPGDPVHDRRHGDRDRGRPPAHLAVRRHARPGAAQHARLLAREALRRRHAR